MHIWPMCRVTPAPPTCSDSASFCAVSAAACASLADASSAANSALASVTKPRCTTVKTPYVKGKVS